MYVSAYNFGYVGMYVWMYVSVYICGACLCMKEHVYKNEYMFICVFICM